jgi:hypothetical protein
MGRGARLDLPQLPMIDLVLRAILRPLEVHGVPTTDSVSVDLVSGSERDWIQGLEPLTLPVSFARRSHQ